ncbi:MAG: hypothetical protein JOZ78_22680 [Chroococcidiopsidaceae cyanobacterium CP_BM_ER_R8_30]|nr:hypothetical protein [Chroococcidiopsidaceae cyanobacterium CP_BM_ER_R8_30]
MSDLAQEQGVASPGQGTLMSPERNQIERMNQLEQALEQSLASLHELRQKLTDQQLLETQLVATEEIANLQQQAINELQRQLAALKQDLIAGQTRIEALETQLAGQHTAQAQLQHAYQEMAAECEQGSSRLEQLEQETTLLQEKLLQQAQQASEYETAVHYWKNLYKERQHQLLELKTALKELLPDPQDQLLDILEAIQPLADIETAELTGSNLSSMPLKKQPLQVDLPAFLIRNRP